MPNLLRRLCALFGRCKPEQQYKERLRTLRASLEQDSHSWGVLPDDDIQRELEETKQQAAALLQHVVKSNELERRRLQHVFDSLCEAVLVVDGNGLITSSNKAAQRLLGPESFANKHLQDFFPDLPDALIVEIRHSYCKFCNIDPYENAEAYVQYLSYAKTVLAKTLTAEYGTSSLELTLNVLTVGDDDESFSFLATMRDLTKVASSVREVSRYKSSMVGLLSIIPVPTFYKDAELKFSAANHSFGELLGLSVADIVGKHNRDLFHPHTAQALDDLDKQTLSSEQAQHRTLDLHFLNGLIRNARVYGRSISDGHTVTGTAGSIMVESDEGLRNKLFQVAAKSIVFFDMQHRVIGCNDEFTRLAGLSKADIIGSLITDTKFGDLFKPSDDSEIHVDTVMHNDRLLDRLSLPVAHSFGTHSAIYVFFAHLEFLDRG